MASADIGEFLVVGGRSAKLATSHEANKLTAITSTASTTHDPARRALGEFLRTMRGRVAPSERSRGIIEHQPTFRDGEDIRADAIRDPRRPELVQNGESHDVFIEATHAW